jgi:hypothetical protein
MVPTRKKGIPLASNMPSVNRENDMAHVTLPDVTRAVWKKDVPVISVLLAGRIKSYEVAFA